MQHWLKTFEGLRAAIESEKGCELTYDMPEEFGMVDFTATRALSIEEARNFYFMWPIIAEFDHEIKQDYDSTNIHLINGTRMVTLRVSKFEEKRVSFSAYSNAGLFASGHLFFNYNTMSPLYTIAELTGA